LNYTRIYCLIAQPIERILVMTEISCFSLFKCSAGCAR